MLACLVNCVKGNSVEHPITLDDTPHRLEDTACQSLDVACTQYLLSGNPSSTTPSIMPLPLRGVPEWHRNERESACCLCSVFCLVDTDFMLCLCFASRKPLSSLKPRSVNSNTLGLRIRFSCARKI